MKHFQDLQPVEFDNMLNQAAEAFGWMRAHHHPSDDGPQLLASILSRLPHLRTIIIGDSLCAKELAWSLKNDKRLQESACDFDEVFGFDVGFYFGREMPRLSKPYETTFQWWFLLHTLVLAGTKVNLSKLVIDVGVGAWADVEFSPSY